METTIHPPRTLDHYRAGLDLMAAAWQEAFADIVDPAALDRMGGLPEQDDLDASFEERRTADAVSILVARKGDDVVGSGSILWDDTATKSFVSTDDAELRTLYVHPDWWGHGIGSELLAALEAEVPASRDRIVLQTFADNEIGRPFYDSHGFDVIARHTFEIADATYPTVVYARDR